MLVGGLNAGFVPSPGFIPAPPKGCASLCRQLDCLRQLVVVLCERSQLQDLVEFPYVNLHNEVMLRRNHGPGRGSTFPSEGFWTHWRLRVLQVVGIIESHARAVDLMTHNYYELLYAFHVYRHNYRKGGAGEGALPPARPPRAVG